MFTITIYSYTRLGEIEWKEIITANNKTWATRKANELIKSTGDDNVIINKSANGAIWDLR